MQCSKYAGRLYFIETFLHHRGRHKITSRIARIMTVRGRIMRSECSPRLGPTTPPVQPVPQFPPFNINEHRLQYSNHLHKRNDGGY